MNVLDLPGSTVVAFNVPIIHPAKVSGGWQETCIRAGAAYYYDNNLVVKVRVACVRDVMAPCSLRMGLRPSRSTSFSLPCRSQTFRSRLTKCVRACVMPRCALSRTVAVQNTVYNETCADKLKRQGLYNDTVPHSR
jgi:hypothetical protein